MTIIAGAFYYGAGRKNVLESIVADLRNHLARSDAGKISEYSDKHFFAIKFDIGAFEGNAFHIDENAGSVALLAGDPLIVESESSPVLGRDESLRRISDDQQAGRKFSLKLSQGTFCAAIYDSAKLELSLAADKLGLRLMYYWRDEEIVVFASALRILENVSFISKRMDIQGVFETACFGFPLADRTPYAGIRCLEAGEVDCFSRGKEIRKKYWAWENIAEDRYAAEDIVTATSMAFSNSIRCRTSDDEETVITFLSGGLDSRLINMELFSQGKQIHSYNFSRPETQDLLLAREFAEMLGLCHHTSQIKVEPFVHPSRYLRKEIETLGFEGGPIPERRNVVWSGDGGSVGLGFVYFSDSFLNEESGKSLERAAHDFLLFNKLGFDGKLWAASTQSYSNLNAIEIVASELERYGGMSRANQYFLFLMQNDQRRHLSGHLEDIDLNRVELQLPFFDGRLMELAFQLKVEDGLYHRFYHRLLEEFSPLITSVPWQTYPGHLPCPLPLPLNASYQWAKEAESWFDRAKSVLQYSWMFEASKFPMVILNWNYLRLVALATLFGVRDYRYCLKMAAPFVRYWRKCDVRS